MPKFPTYRGELPRCLNPFKPGHWFLLLYWIFFRPTAFKCYLYQADPELYRSGPGLGIFRTLHNPAYRNLYVIVPIAIVLLPTIISLPYTLLVNWFIGAPMDWSILAYGMMIGVVIGGAVGVPISIVLGMIDSVAYGIANGIMIGVLFGVLGGIAGGLIGGALNIEATIMFYVEAGITFSLAQRIMIAWLNFMKRWMWFIVPLMMICLPFIFYPFQCILARYGKLLGIRHPLEWWEEIFLPLPLTKELLLRKLQQDQESGLYFIGELACNPFQRWVAQAVLYRYLHSYSNPLFFLYVLLEHLQLDEYVIVPMRKKDWNHNTTLRHLLLGTLALKSVESRYKLGIFLKRIVWWPTLLLYQRRRTSLTDFAGMLYELLDKEMIKAKHFTLRSYHKIYTNLSAYPGGKELAGTFKAMAAFLSYKNLRSLPRAAEIVSNLVFDDPIRPTVLAVLNRLGEVGAEIAIYQDSTSRTDQLAALAHATNTLKNLNEYIQVEVMIPEQYLLQRIIRQWQHLISKAKGKLRWTE